MLALRKIMEYRIKVTNKVGKEFIIDMRFLCYYDAIELAGKLEKRKKYRNVEVIGDYVQL